MDNKIVFIMKEHSENFRIIECFKNKRDETISTTNEIKTNLFKYDNEDLIIHDIPIATFNPNLQKIKAKNLTTIEAFGCEWKALFTQTTQQEFLNSGILDFPKTEPNYNLLPLRDFFDEIQQEFQKKSYFGTASDYHQYTFNFNEFYEFLKMQYFPDIKSLSKKNIIVDKLKPDSFSKFILALHMYEGFAVCSSLITDEIQLDEINIFSEKNNHHELIIPFNLFKYLIKYKNITELYINRFYVCGKKKIDFNDELSNIEKIVTIAGLCERGDILTKMYVRYYFFIFALKYFKEDIISIDLKRKIVHTYNKNIQSKLFLPIK